MSDTIFSTLLLLLSFAAGEILKTRHVPSFCNASVAAPETNAIRIFIDSMFFATDEKTEDPTPKKLSEARKKGQVAKSTDLNSVIILVLMAILLVFAGEYGFERMCMFLYGALSNADYMVTEGNLRALMNHYAYSYFSVMIVVFGTVMASGTAANLFQSGFLFSVEPLKPNFKKLNPVEGFKNLFSKKTVFNLAKTLFKFVLVGTVAYFFAKENLPKVFSAAGMEAKGVFPLVKDLVYDLVVRIAVVLGILAAADYAYQKYDFKKNLRMTKNEIKEEMKQMEGDPQIKSQRKQKQRQMSMSRMMADVPKATVVLTNPTHLSIALRYEEKNEEVPVIVAKGADLIAMRIREIAGENDIPIIENKPLARTLYKRSEVGDEVPADLYQAVAEILAAVYRMKNRKHL